MTSIPAIMTAVIIKSSGGPQGLVLEARPVPRHGEGEILIKVARKRQPSRCHAAQRALSSAAPRTFRGSRSRRVALSGVGISLWNPGDQVAAAERREDDR